MLITVIVPIYNMEAYLCTSLDRLLQQSFQDYEILLIDDGSKDSSGEICDRYAREHSRIRVVHKPNGGLSTARNAGIEHARGEYLTFCDPDDWVDADYLQQFVEAGMDEHTLPVTGILQHREGKSDRRLTAPAMDVQGQACTEAIVALRRHDMLGFTSINCWSNGSSTRMGSASSRGSRTGKTKSSCCNTFPTFRASSSTKKRPTTTGSSAAASPKNASRRS